MPVAVTLRLARLGAAVLAVPHVVRFTAGRGLVAAAGVLASLVAQRHQAAQVDRDVVGLGQCQRQIRGSRVGPI